MSAKATIRFHSGEGREPSWHLYVETLEKAEVVYFELEGIEADITMIGAFDATNVLLRLPVATARQLSLLPDKPVGQGTHTPGSNPDAEPLARLHGTVSSYESPTDPVWPPDQDGD